ncbi:FAD linked oxidase domain-containing protein [Rutstroemia sp. NJR-2017a WRK4]|nr:FAD linked oxidase domain-containing protein [Rutstroemia sp. NJR-2017a WRK4]
MAIEKALITGSKTPSPPSSIASSTVSRKLSLPNSTSLCSYSSGGGKPLLPSCFVAPTCTTDIPSACSILSSSLPGKVFFPNSTSYISSLNSYYSDQEQSLSPSCVVAPTCTADVSKIITILNTRHLSGSSDGLFAIRAGGHATFSGAANIANGVTIDLTNLNGIEFLTSDKSIVSVGPGARWGAVYDFLQPHNLTVVGGRGTSIGVGGYLLGGGISFLGQQRGWACDASNIVGYEVVLASGAAVYATANNQYSDLFLALKGGSNNFGVVTRFDLAAYNQGELWGGFISYPLTLLESLLASFSSFMSPAGYDPHADLLFSVGYINPGGIEILTVAPYYTKPIVAPPVFQPFYNTSASQFSTMRISNMSDFVAEQDAYNPYGFRQLYMTASFAHTPDIYAEIYDCYKRSTALVASITGVGYYMTLQPTPLLNGTNILGLSSSDQRIVIALITVSYTQSTDDATVANAAETFFEGLSALTAKYGVSRSFMYLNYALGSVQKPFHGYGETNKAKLEAVSEKYDAGGLFQHGVPGGFKLFV